MQELSAPDPDPCGRILVGQDHEGRWLVQENQGRTETHCISRDAALRFAQWERHAHPHAVIEVATEPLVPAIAA